MVWNVLIPLHAVGRCRSLYPPGLLVEGSLLDIDHLVVRHGGVDRAIEASQGIYLVKMEIGIVWFFFSSSISLRE